MPDTPRGSQPREFGRKGSHRSVHMPNELAVDQPFRGESGHAGPPGPARRRGQAPGVRAARPRFPMADTMTVSGLASRHAQAGHRARRHRWQVESRPTRNRDRRNLPPADPSARPSRAGDPPSPDSPGKTGKTPPCGGVSIGGKRGRPPRFQGEGDERSGNGPLSASAGVRLGCVGSLCRCPRDPEPGRQSSGSHATAPAPPPAGGGARSSHPVGDVSPAAGPGGTLPEVIGDDGQGVADRGHRGHALAIALWYPEGDRPACAVSPRAGDDVCPGSFGDGSWKPTGPGPIGPEVAVHHVVDVGARDPRPRGNPVAFPCARGVRSRLTVLIASGRQDLRRQVFG